jgi:hypothetical protein
MKRLAARPAVLHTTVLLGLAAYTVGMMWPLPAAMRDHVIGAKYYWDAYTNDMALGARVQNLLGIGAGGHYESYFFAPIPNSIAFNENLFGLSLLYAPFHLLTGEPLLAYNITLLLSLTLSAYFMALLVRRLTGSLLAGLLCGAAFAFCPYAFFEMGRIQLVATQWIPLTFLFLHRAIEERRLRDLVGLGLSYALQVGTCLYYAMFMLPVLALVGGYLVFKHRPGGRAFLLQVAAVGAGTGGLIVAMIFPYFASRKHFDLTRTEDFASQFDGELSFLANVAPTNRLLTFLHHEGEEKGAHEEVAFPGFTIVLLCAIGLIAPLLETLRTLEPARRPRAVLTYLGGAAALLAASVGLTLLSHSFLGALFAIVVCVVGLSVSGRSRGLYPPEQRIYVWFVPLIVALFLGMAPFTFQGEDINGLYYYLYHHVPGFNGIRKVSRQAILVMFGCAALAGFGAAWAFRALQRPWARGSLFVALAVLITAEFLTAPSSLVALPSGSQVSKAYRWIAEQPGKGYIGLVPADEGKLFRGHRGMARHNYFTLFHRRRTLNGKSSFIPPVTWLYNAAVHTLPSPTSTRILQILRAEFLVLHTWDMGGARARRVMAVLDASARDYARAFEAGGDVVYRLLPQNDPSLGLLETPSLPAGLSEVPRSELSAQSSATAIGLRLPFDGDPETKWATRRNQRQGDWFEFVFQQPTKVAAVTFTDFAVAFDAPLAFQVSAEAADGSLHPVFTRPRLRIYSEQIYHPNGFEFRLVLPKAVETRRLRFTLMEAVPGRWWSIHEAHVYRRP